MSCFKSSAKTVFQRLPKNVTPLLYQITLTPHLDKHFFHGYELIKVKINNQTREIVLNSLDLHISNATFKQNGLDFPGTIEIASSERAIIRFDKDLTVGEGCLELYFDGILNDKLVGFYRSQYELNGKTYYAATTKFEPTHARRAFPCWDEPAIKALFKVTVVAPKDRLALSNTLIEKIVEHPDDASLKIVTFKQTPLMSTYLFAVIISHYDVLEGHTKRGTLVRVFTPVGKSLQGTYGLDCALRALEWLEDYFDIPYPLEKLDHVPIADFASGAMENWGLITYRETTLLVDPANTSMAAKQNIARVISHETSHQWFGNLVTMEWWTHLWLNEGFASFMQYLVVEALYPEYEYWKQFCIDASVTALDLDASHRSHPIEVPVNAPEEIISIFDAISYQKGASVIRMCHNCIGDEAFQKGMNIYLTRHKYKNTVTEDLWRALEDSSSKPVQKMMSTWTEKMGFPLVSVELVRQGNKTWLTLTQEKFSVDGKICGDEVNHVWMIPLSFISSTNPKNVHQLEIMDKKMLKVAIDNVPEGGWIKLNPSLLSFYRVNYPNEMWSALGEAVKTKTLCPEDRLQIIDDLSALNYAGKAPIDLLFKMLQNYSNEDDYVPWTGVDRCLMRLNRLMDYTDLKVKYQKFARDLISPIYAKIGFDKQPNEKSNTALMRIRILVALVTFNDERVLNEAKKRFELHINGKKLEPDLRSIVYKAIARADDETYEKLFKLYYDSDMAEEKTRIALSLGFTENASRIERVLKFALSSDVRIQDAWTIIISSANNLQGQQLAWKFFQDHVKEIKERYGNQTAVRRLIKRLTENFASIIDANDVARFFANHLFPGSEDVVLQSIEKIKTNANWLAKEIKALQNYFSK